jgi:ubiquinol-cytochrome c reductase cytochrome b subunit
MWIGAKPAEGVYIIIGQICTFAWFAHFIVVVPLVSLLETPKRVPGSIHEYMQWRSEGKIKVMPWMR